MSFGNRLYELRKKRKMTQESLAEVLGVSRQSVRKWEADFLLPEAASIIKISKFFGVSTDWMFFGGQKRMFELQYKEKVIPAFESISEWEFYGSALSEEYMQSYDEGIDIEKYKDLFTAVAMLPKSTIKKELSDIIQKIVLNTPQRENFKYIEPLNLKEIKLFRKNYDLPNEKTIELEDKISGAWNGRICGCMLGKTVECIKSTELRNFLKSTNNYPLNRYIYKSDLNKVNLKKYDFNFLNREYADAVNCMPVDDDTNYTVLGQLIFDKYGVGFTSENVAFEWVKNQSKEAYCTAERVAFCNFIKGYLPPASAVHKNPYREWIGAQIRADYWGYINPGNPERAAEMAWRDASVSHVKNGIYGEMFVAAMLASAAVTDDMEAIVEAGLAQIPYTSRLYESITEILRIYKSKKSSKDCFCYIHSKYDENTEYGWCHSIPNAMIVVAALLYGKGDFGKSVCMAVETGFDTDCNGATVGSVFGMAHGIKAIDKKWTEPFCDTLDTSVFEVGKVSISECVKKTLLHIEQIKNEF